MKRIIIVVLAFCGLILLLGRMPARRPPARLGVPAVRAIEATTPAGADPAKPAAPPEDKRRLLRELAGKIRADDYCRLHETLAQKSRTGPNPDRDRDTLRYHALLLANGEGVAADPCVLATLARTREDVLRFASQSERTECRLVRGLLLSGQWNLTHVAPPATDGEKVRGAAILEILARENPQNGFFSFVAMGALPGAETEARRAAYREFLSARNFENPLAWPVKEKLLELSRSNPTAWFLASEIATGWVDYVPAEKIVKAFPAEDRAPAEFASWAAALGERFSATDRAALAEPFVDLGEDAVLRSIVLMGRESLPALPKIFEQESWVGYFRRRVPYSAEDLQPQRSCEEMLERAREKFSRIVRKNDESADLVRRVRPI